MEANNKSLKDHFLLPCLNNVELLLALLVFMVVLLIFMVSLYVRDCSCPWNKCKVLSWSIHSVRVMSKQNFFYHGIVFMIESSDHHLEMAYIAL